MVTAAKKCKLLFNEFKVQSEVSSGVYHPKARSQIKITFKLFKSLLLSWRRTNLSEGEEGNLNKMFNQRFALKSKQEREYNSPSSPCWMDLKTRSLPPPCPSSVWTLSPAWSLTLTMSPELVRWDQEMWSPVSPRHDTNQELSSPAALITFLSPGCRYNIPLDLSNDTETMDLKACSMCRLSF